MVCCIILIVQVFLLMEIKLAQFVLKDLAIQRVLLTIFFLHHVMHNSNCAGVLVNGDKTNTVCPEGFSNTKSIVNHILLASCDALAEHIIYIIVYLLIT